MNERIFLSRCLNPIEQAVVSLTFDWKKEAWFKGRVHPISRLAEQTEWIQKKQFINSREYPPVLGFVYQITPFIFQDEAATEATGAHFIIPEAKYMNTVLFTDTDYYWRARVVGGAGWLDVWHPEIGTQHVWVAALAADSPVFGFSKDWLGRFRAAEGYGPLIIEGIDLPEYKADGEQVIEENTPLLRLSYRGRKRVFDLRRFWKP